jgi:hypothetical protein
VDSRPTESTVSVNKKVVGPKTARRLSTHALAGRQTKALKLVLLLINNDKKSLKHSELVVNIRYYSLIHTHSSFKEG